MKVCALIEHMCGLGVGLQVKDGMVRFNHPELVTEELRRELAEHKGEIISHMMCPVCNGVKWARNIPGGGVFCGGCNEPEDLGLTFLDTNAADMDDLRHVWEDSEFWIRHKRAKNG